VKILFLIDCLGKTVSGKLLTIISQLLLWGGENGEGEKQEAADGLLFSAFCKEHLLTESLEMFDIS